MPTFYSPCCAKNLDSLPAHEAFNLLTVDTHVLVSYRPHVDVKKLSRNTKVVAEALARVIYNLTEKVEEHSELLS